MVSGRTAGTAAELEGAPEAEVEGEVEVGVGVVVLIGVSLGEFDGVRQHMRHCRSWRCCRSWWSWCWG
ncbi:hypothetical protein SL103_35430 [Streptomyces lydicus]|uniref:Uncharacterized protein n=1 Tax=Streptomyces lydicus TaxID=47763 RepID=A0A1D7VVS1_9ACTN|nr:hypothetical protein SL103_35430 [Streptomyces lydicus]